MMIAVVSQNLKTVTGHAGKARRFVVFDASLPSDPEEVGRLDLPREMAMHEFVGGAHPLDGMDVIITASAGEGFVRKLSQRGVKVVVTGELDVLQAVQSFLSDRAVPPKFTETAHRHEGCGCGHGLAS